jgi:two-component system, cell cycle sensor histidine kinase and response regulator CckA
VLVYLVISVLWIIFSDRALMLLVPNRELQMLLQSGKGLFFISISAALIYFLLKGQLAALLTEIEERTETEQKLAESENRYRSLFFGNKAVMLLVDPDNAKIIDANPAAADFYGWSVEILKTMTLYDIDFMTKSEVQGNIFRAAQEERNHFYFTHRLADGRLRNVEVYSSPIRFENRQLLYSIVHDITERIQIQERHQELEMRLAAILDAAPVGILALDTEGIVLFWNKASESIFGYSAEEATGRFLPYVNENQRAEFDSLHKEVLSGKSFFNLEVNRQHKDGHTIPISISAAPIGTPKGNIDGIISVVEDLTSRNKLLSENKKLSEQFFQIQKMESIGRLAGGIAHDFNNLLVPISGFAEMGQKRLPDDDPLQEFFQQIEAAADRAAALTRQILAFSRQQILETKPLDLNLLIINFQKMLKRLIGENILMEVHQESALSSINGDPGQIEQILLNLVVNARDAMPNGGRLSIETANVSLDDHYCQTYPDVLPGNYVMMSVSDTGTGIDKQTQQRIFEPFFTTKAQGEGTGLGLATVFGIVKQHDGHINLYSEKGLGTTFKIYFPAESKTVEISESEKIDPLSLAGQETILLAEDDTNVRNFLTMSLHNHGYHILEAETGEVALQIAKDYKESIHLLLTDVIMPKMNGRELAEAFANLHPEARLLYMSGYTKDVIAHHGVLDDGVPLIQKPFSLFNLLKKIRDVLS